MVQNSLIYNIVQDLTLIETLIWESSPDSLSWEEYQILPENLTKFKFTSVEEDILEKTVTSLAASIHINFRSLRKRKHS